MKKFIFTMLALLSGILVSYSQKVAVKTNLLYGVYASAPNVGLELGLSKRSTLDLGVGGNWFNPADKTANKKLIHWLGQAEYRYWFCEKFNGHFIGGHVLGTQYNISGHELPMVFGKGSKEYRYEGWGAGVGISYGYQFFLGNRWSLEATLGVGYVRLEYDQFRCQNCGRKVGPGTRNYIGPTKAGISLIYIIK